ncbi:MAG TPA: putative baseplate assembly protein [Candidatus Binatia bacterium]|jgi:predicted phage baseplate assembly protein
MSPAAESSLRALNDCGCCEGITARTPLEIANRPGLKAISYRIGTHATFKQSMLARLSSAGLPALAKLRTRANDDFSIALLDAGATIADVLTFYQERFANEFYLRTATERRSILELARLIGYELRPGVAASAYLVFTLEDSPGDPEKAIKQTAIDVGTKVQSIPAPGEKPQVFETVEKIEARVEWNAIKPRLTERHPIERKAARLLFEGLATGLKPGDGLLLQPDDKSDPVFRQVAKVALQPRQQRTEVHLVPLPSSFTGLGPTVGLSVFNKTLGLGAPTTKYFSTTPKPAADLHAAAIMENFKLVDVFANLFATRPAPPDVLAFRTRAAIFGHNAPKFESLPVSQRFGEYGYVASDKWEFIKGAYIGRGDKWADTTLDNYYDNAPNSSHVYLDQTYPTIMKDSWIVLKDGNAATPHQVESAAEISKAEFALSAKVTHLVVKPGGGFQNFKIRQTTVFAQSEELKLARLPIDKPVSGTRIDLDNWVDGLFMGQSIMVCGELETNRGVNACERVEIVNVEHVLESEGFTRLTVSALKNVYVRETVTLYGNVARATHGETVQEVLGSGDAAVPYQQFSLRPPRLTYVKAANPSGAESTLQVRINDLLWHEAPTLYGHGPNDRIFVTEIDDGGITTVTFGDGATGARLPTGRQNVRATARKGIGVEGLVRAGQLSMLLSRPLGVKGVNNPLDAEGAADAESMDDARRNASLTVLTLDRVVSLKDYEDFSCAFAGVAKALATWSWDGKARGVFVTVAGVAGAAISTDSDTYVNLLAALGRAGDPFVSRRVESYRKALFRIAAKVKVHPDHIAEKVLQAVEQALRAEFSFDARAFGQPVTASELIAVIQAVPGVVAVDLDKLYRPGQPSSARLDAATPLPGEAGALAAAELLTLDPGPLELGAMP